MPRKKTSGFSKDDRFRTREEKALEIYVGQADFIGNDPERDRLAKIEAVDRSGNRRLTNADAKIKWFNRLWKSDEVREYMREIWAFEIEEDPDPISLIMRMVKEHMVQDNSKWGPPDRSVSMQATNAAIKMFIPTQTTVSKNLNLTAKLERPEQLDQERPMVSRTVLPAGQKITKPAAPTGADEESDDEDDDDE